MRKIKRIIAVFAYLFMVALALRLNWMELINVRQFVLVVVGGIILYLPSVEWKEGQKKNSLDYCLFARNTLYASYIVTFLLLFFMLRGGAGNSVGLADSDGAWNAEALMKNIALSLRPLLYGICIWIALGGEEKKDKGENEQQDSPKKVWTAQECYERFLELGLTRREAEVAMQIGKGLSNKEIAVELNISETTVKKHIANIFEKLDVKKREEIKQRLIE